MTDTMTDLELATISILGHRVLKYKTVERTTVITGLGTSLDALQLNFLLYQNKLCKRLFTEIYTSEFVSSMLNELDNIGKIKGNFYVCWLLTSPDHVKD